MKQHVIAAAAAVTLAGGVAAAAIGMAQTATAAAKAPSISAHATTTISLVAVTKTNTRVPIGGAEVDAIENQAGRAVGAGSLVCRVTSEKAPAKCAVSLNLPGGDLFFAVTTTQTGAAGPLAGGTGRYAGATGKVVATGISKTRTRVVVTLHK